MPTKKIADKPKWEYKPCLDPDHDPAKYRVYESGVWEHECPTCHRKMQFVIDEVRC